MLLRRHIRAQAATREQQLQELADTKGRVARAMEDTVAIKSTDSVDDAAPTDPSDEAGLRLLTKDDFWEFLEESGDKLAVIDFFTDWCGPCKVMYPMLVEMAQEQPDVSFAKLNCNKYNKELGVQLGVKVAPTFQLYKNSTKVAEMTGAKIDALKELIAKHK